MSIYVNKKVYIHKYKHTYIYIYTYRYITSNVYTCKNTYIYIHTYIYIYIYMQIQISISKSKSTSILLSKYIPKSISTSMFIHVCLCFYLSIRLSICLSVGLSVYLSIYRSIQKQLCIDTSLKTYTVSIYKYSCIMWISRLQMCPAWNPALESAGRRACSQECGQHFIQYTQKPNDPTEKPWVSERRAQDITHGTTGSVPCHEPD